jgi:hypothetical protein
MLHITSHTRRYLENGYKGKDSVQQGTGIGHQRLLVLHEESRDEELGSGQAAPHNSHTSQHKPQQPSATHKSAIQVVWASNIQTCTTDNLLYLYAGKPRIVRGLRWRIALRHCATSLKVAASLLDGIFHLISPSGRTVALGSTQTLTAKSAKNVFWRVEDAGAYSLQTYHLYVPTV